MKQMIGCVSGCLLLLAVLVIVPARGPVQAQAQAPVEGKGFNVFWNDVEGGAATLIVTPAGESILIDTGNPGDRDPGRIVKSAKEHGLTQIDYLITSHFHIDHFGGAATVHAQIPIKKIYDNGDEFSPTDRPPSQAYRDIPAERIKVNPGDTLPLKEVTGPKFTVKFLAARKKFIDPPAGAKPFTMEVPAEPVDNTDNAYSIVTLISYGDFRFFAGGDLTWNVEKDLVTPVNRVGTVDVYQVTHHGLDQSNNPAVVKALEPMVAVMSNGTRKGTQPKTMATLKGTASIKDIWQIHKNLRPADMEVNNTVAELIANTEVQCEGHGIKMVIAPDAKSYTISIPATNVSRKYETKAK